jgi:molybdate transport system substrate-binding protein
LRKSAFEQVLIYVERGEVDAGFVYMTYAKIAQLDHKIDINVPVSTLIIYPIAVEQNRI